MNETEIFTEALKLAPGNERNAFLDRQCGSDIGLRARVANLLDAAPGHDPLLDGEKRWITTSTFRIEEKAGSQIGRYRLMEQIGEGGFGQVFVAEQQEPVRRRVALKVIKPGMDTKQVIRRFEAERQALAIMDHPNIARVLDAGTTDSGLPYFVMELVRGIPITEYCDKNHLAPNDRLGLFVAVCQAIQHAHQKGVIHRDIKPSNVLVTSHDGKPVAKVIDFGVAKAIHQPLTDRTIYTQFTQMIGTPLYMSPEQAEMSGLDIDTRSDIYSLGVLLYELLTGSTPLENRQLVAAAFDEVRRLIREQEPPRPSQRLSSSGTLVSLAANRSMEPARLTRLLKGEVDWIVMKALEKDRTRRYESAGAFAADVNRYLNNEAVEACPPSLSYRTRKSVRRFRIPLTIAAVFAACLLVGAGVSTWFAFEAERQKELAISSRDAEMQAREKESEQRKHVEASQRDLSDRNEQLLSTQQELRRTLYTSDMNLVQLAAEDRDTNRIRKLMDNHRPHAGQSDLRGFEWYFWNQQIHAQTQTIKLSNWAPSLSVSSNGCRIIGHGLFLIASKEDSLLRWDLSSGKLTESRIPVPSFVHSRITLDGSLLLTIDSDQLTVLDCKSGRELFRNEIPPKGATAFFGGRYAAISDDGRNVACAVNNQEVKVWSIDSGKEIHNIEPVHKGASYYVSFTPDPKQLIVVTPASGSTNGPAIAFYNLTDGSLDKVIQSQSGMFTFSTDGRQMAAMTFTDSGKGHLELFDLEGVPRSRWSVPVESRTNQPVFSDDNRWVACADKGTVRVFETATGSEHASFLGHSMDILCLGFSSKTKSFFSIDKSGLLCYWPKDDFQRQVALPSAEPTTARIVASDSLKRFLSCSGRITQSALSKYYYFSGTQDFAELTVLDDEGAKLFEKRFDVEYLCDATLDAAGSRVAAVLAFDDRPPDQASRIAVFDVASGRELCTLDSPAEFEKRPSDGRSVFKAPAIWLNPDGRRLAVFQPKSLASPRSTLKIFNADTGAQELEIDAKGEDWLRIRWSPDGKWLATAMNSQVFERSSGSTNLSVWNAQSGDLIWTQGCDFFQFSKGGQSALAFSRRLGQHFLDVVDLKNGAASSIWQSLRQIEEVQNGYYQATQSDDGQLVAVLELLDPETRTIYVLDLQNPDSGPVVMNLSSRLTRDVLAFSPDGTRLAISCFLNGETSLWNPRTGESLLTIPFGSRQIAFSNDGQELRGWNFTFLGKKLSMARWNAGPIAPEVESAEFVDNLLSDRPDQPLLFTEIAARIESAPSLSTTVKAMCFEALRERYPKRDVLLPAWLNAQASNSTVQRYERAEAYAREALLFTPNDRQWLTVLGWAQFRLKDQVGIKKTRLEIENRVRADRTPVTSEEVSVYALSEFLDGNREQAEQLIRKAHIQPSRDENRWQQLVPELEQVVGMPTAEQESERWLNRQVLFRKDNSFLQANGPSLHASMPEFCTKVEGNVLYFGDIRSGNRSHVVSIDDAHDYLEKKSLCSGLTVDDYEFLGKCFFQFGQFEQAHEQYAAGLAVTFNPTLRLDRARLYAHEGKDDLALAELDVPVRLPELIYHFEKAEILFDLKRFQEALDEINQAIAGRDKNYAPAFAIRARVYVAMGEYEKANQDFEKGIQLDPNSAVIWNLRAWSLATAPNLANRDPVNAIEYATKAAELDGWYGDRYLDTLAAAYASSGDFEKAIRWQTEAIARVPLLRKGLYEARLELYRNRKPYVSNSEVGGL